MSHHAAAAGRLPNKLLLYACLVLAALSNGAQAQRHPESAGPLPYYRDEPGVWPQPDWLNRPPFIRGPLDRYQRGRDRTFLGTEDGVPYLNYADGFYVLYLREAIPWTAAAGRPEFTRFVRWDRLGSYMGPSYHKVFSWEEARSGSDNSGASYIDHKGAGVLTMRIGHYSYKALHWTVTAGTDVRSVFTPLTMSLGHMEVARVDLDYQGKDRATLLFNRGRSGLFSQWGQVPGDTYEQTPVLMYGLHWQHDFGSYANLGTTFLNQFTAFPSSPRSSAFRGDLPYDMLGPKQIRVFVGDDSPEETQANGRVYSIDIILKGAQNGVPVHLTSIADAAQRTAQAGDADFDPRLAAVVTGGRSLADGSRLAVGKETVVYAFALPPEVTVRSVRFAAEVADDYRIGVRQTYDYMSVDRKGNPVAVEQQWPASFTRSDAGKRLPFKWYIDIENEEPYYTVARAPGHRSGGANRRMVSFDYGMPTGQSLASVDWNANLVGLKLSGEVANNLQNFMLPVGDNEGQRHSKTAWAYWLNALKELPYGMQAGGELYRLEPDYSGDYDSSRGGMAFHSDQAAGTRVQSVTQEFSLVEDNDDDDQWPDEMLQETIQSGETYPGWPNAGTYPGLDENSDNIADVDRNENFVEDWQESFLMYDADPPDYVYGVDFNNNSVPDFRENDDLPDYPYARDQKGHHLFVRLGRLGWLGNSLAAGYYSSRRIDGTGEDRTFYLRYLYEAKKTRLGDVRLNYDLKQVKDDIPNATYIYQVPPEDVDIIPWLNTPDGPPERAGLYRAATPDLLTMRDSWVHTAFLSSKYQGFRDIILGSSLMWVRNSQAQIALDDGSGLLQPDDVRGRFSMVNKIEYTWSRGSLNVRPRLKHRLIYEAVESEDDPRTSSTDLIPIVLAEYRLTANTQIMAGVEGLPGVPYKHWDRLDKEQTFGQTDYLAMLKLRAEYQGIGTTFYVGYQRTHRDYSQSRDQNFKHGTLFMDVISAF